MEWTLHGERAIYASPWVNLTLVDVELPDGSRFEHHVARIPRPASSLIVHDAERGILLMWRHRFITDRWGWEVPGGRVDEDETPIEAAAREAEEETGWRPGPVETLFSYNPFVGLTDQVFNVFVASEATYTGEPMDKNESERVEWVPVERVRALIHAGEIRDGLSLTGLLWYLSVGTAGPV